MSWIELDQRYVWHPFTQMLGAPPPVPIERAEGAYLVTSDGRRILDGISSWWVNIHGHAHPRLNRALAAQAEKMAQVIYAGCAHEPAARLSKSLIDISPPGLEKVFFSDNGSTAVEVALKMAYQVWRNRGESRRTRFLALEGAYHGDTVGAMSVGGVPVFHGTYQDLLFDVERVPVPEGIGDPSSGAAAEVAEDIARRMASDPTLAGVVLEPMIQGAGGMVIWPASFLARVREVTAEQGVLLIADEVFTGFGRTGRMFACEHADVTPDLMCLSKALTAGMLPMSVTLSTQEVFDAFLSEDKSRTFFHGHSFTANALACAVANESLALFHDEDRLGRVQQLEALFAERLARLNNYPSVRYVRGLGGVAVVELDGAGYLDGVGARISERLLEQDFLLRPLGNVIYFLPPYVVTDSECHAVFDALEAILD